MNKLVCGSILFIAANFFAKSVDRSVSMCYNKPIKHIGNKRIKKLN